MSNPPLPIVEKKSQVANKFGPASPTAWAEMTYKPTSEAVPSEAQLAEIQTAWATIGIPAEQFFPVAFQLAMTASDAHASSLTIIPGQCVVAPTVPLKSAASLVRSVTTLRQFCRYYAKFVWNWRVQHNTPPANWADSGYNDESKYAAFDFFDGVTNTAALDPPTGLVRPPSDLELNASQTNKYVSLARKRPSGFTSTAAEVTHGRAAAYEVQLLEAP